MEYTDWNNKTILIAEDEEFNFIFIEEVLCVTGAKILRAKDGSQAIEMVKEHKEIDIILMDIKMPVLNGYEATKQIKKIRPDLPVVVQTAFAMPDERVTMMQSGCDEYIVKPLEEVNVLETINKYLK
jgi:two-component system, cell cycle response regulator DivK